MSDELLTFSELRKIEKKEKRQDDLTELDDKFLLNFSEYMKTKKELSDDTREYKNAKRVLNKIISLREDKIVKKAKIAAKTGVNAQNLNLLPSEQELYRELKEKFSDHRERIEKQTKSREEIKTKTVETETEEEPETQPEPETKPKEEEKKENTIEEGYLKIKALSKIPEFMGTDLEAYGPLKEGESAIVPEENAEILINRGNAEEIQSQ